MALAARPAQLVERLSELQQQQQLEAAGSERVAASSQQAQKRATSGASKASSTAAAGSKKGRAAFGDITNRSNKSHEESYSKECIGLPSVQQLAVPSTAATEPSCDNLSPAPTPSHLIKRIRFSDSFVPEAALQQSWVDIDKDNRKLAGLTCPAYVVSTFHQLRVAETKKRPSTTYMDTVQNDINPSMRTILVDWLVEVAAEYKLHSDTLFLTVAYIDRYLSVVPVPRSELQLVGVACMLVASKYEEIYAPTVEDFCYITDHTYSRERLLAAEQSVLAALRFEMTAPTTKTFLRRFLDAAAAEQLPGVKQELLEVVATYLAELSLLEYGLLRFLPSTIAAAAVLVALTMLGCRPGQTDGPGGGRCWGDTLSHYTGYEPRALRAVANGLYTLFLRAGTDASPPAVREKYSHDELVQAPDLHCYNSLPEEVFQ